MFVQITKQYKVFSLNMEVLILCTTLKELYVVLQHSAEQVCLGISNNGSSRFTDIFENTVIEFNHAQRGKNLVFKQPPSISKLLLMDYATFSMSMFFQNRHGLTMVLAIQDQSATKLS